MMKIFVSHLAAVLAPGLADTGELPFTWSLQVMDRDGEGVGGGENGEVELDILLQLGPAVKEENAGWTVE